MKISGCSCQQWVSDASYVESFKKAVAESCGTADISGSDVMNVVAVNSSSAVACSSTSTRLRRLQSFNGPEASYDNGGARRHLLQSELDITLDIEATGKGLVANVVADKLKMNVHNGVFLAHLKSEATYLNATGLQTAGITGIIIVNENVTDSSARSQGAVPVGMFILQYFGWLVIVGICAAGYWFRNKGKNTGASEDVYMTEEGNARNIAPPAPPPVAGEVQLNPLQSGAVEMSFVNKIPPMTSNDPDLDQPQSQSSSKRTSVIGNSIKRMSTIGKSRTSIVGNSNKRTSIVGKSSALDAHSLGGSIAKEDVGGLSLEGNPMHRQEQGQEDGQTSPDKDKDKDKKKSLLTRISHKIKKTLL